jgi:hypothetical protein
MRSKQENYDVVILTLSPDLDNRFGWRWLLPLHDNDQLALIGFTDHEVAFWKQALSVTPVTADAAAATVWVVQDNPPIRVFRFATANLHTVCVVGSRSVVAEWQKWMGERFANVHDYALLPPGNPRVVVPLGVSDWVVQALALHRPGRASARLVVKLLKILARAGFDLPLRSRMVCIGSNSASVLPQGAWQAGLELNGAGDPKAFALYLGTPNENRKTVILPLGGARQVILKCGESPKAQAAIRNEAAALNALCQTPLASQVPALQDVVEHGNHVTLCLEYRERQTISKAGLKRAVVAFLSGLSKLDKSNRPLASVLGQSNLLTSSEARRTGQVAYAEVRDRLDALAAMVATVWGHRSHGDFAPWNCAWTVKGFFVFDWEESRVWDVALGDAFYFAVAPAVHVARSPNPQAVESTALALAGGVTKDAGLPVGDIRIYWALWLLQCTGRQPSPLYGRLLERLAASWQ